ncbi:MAG: endolytic transglycosylase MltG [Propionibacteriaceae bacterium]|nr:endolytic transglycosylase MltG [Propionibacteriaceae bacterium]
MTDDNEKSWIAPESTRRARSAIAVSLSFIVLLAGVAVVGWKGFSFYMDWRQKDDYIGKGDQEIQFIVHPGDGWAVVADGLLGMDIIRDPGMFEREALKLSDGPFAGTWKLKTKLPAKTAAQMLTDRENQVFVRFTVKEGTRQADMYAFMTKELGMTQPQIDAAIEAILADPTAYDVMVPVNGRLEGVLFPDTYLLYPPMDTEDPALVFQRMAQEFNTVLKDINFEKKAKALGVSTYDAIIIASIIEAEVNQDQYRPDVAQAIYNRLNSGMILQIDTIVNYGLDRSGYANLDNHALNTDTPYNTYMHKGLPPTPISLPSRASLEAAVNPTEGKLLYWCAVNLETGETRFAETVEQHDVNRQIYQQWCRDHPDICQ